MTRHRTRIKICGIRDEAMALAAAEAGADAVGLVFHAASPRAVRPGEARRIAVSLPALVAGVGLFVNAPAEEVRAVLDEVPLAMLQFHGDESAEFCAQFGRPWIRALRVAEGIDLLEFANRFSGAAGLLLDAHVPGRFGGTGSSFDWSLVPPALASRTILSGGLDPRNVGEAIRRVRPWAVDVSSGVEVERGRKDAARIVEFVRSVRDADARVSD